MLHKSEMFLQPRYYEIAFFIGSVLWIFSCVWRAQIMIHNFFSSSVLFVYNIPYILLLSFSFIFDVCHCTTMTNHIFFAPGSWRRRQGIYKIRFSDYTSKCFSTPVIVLWFTETNETLCTRRNHHCQWHSLFSFS